MKKIISLLLCILMLASCFVMSVSAKDETLRFGKDGKFTIVIFADSQDDEKLEATTTALMETAIQKEKPDLVVFLGDNTVATGKKKQTKAIEALLQPCLDSKTPFAIIFGNHDQENKVSKEDLLKIYRKYGCLTYDADPSIYGCGNCNLPIYASKGSKIAFNLWFTDSGSSFREGDDKKGYDYVRKSQIRWYKNTEKALTEKNGGVPVPSINFQHIAPCETYEALGMLELPFGYEEWYTDGKYYLSIPAPDKFEGIAFESPSASYYNAGHVDALLKYGKVLGTFVGHDHVNTFVTNYKGMNITNVPSVGCSSYNKLMTRGYGVITLNEKDTSTYDYSVKYYSDLAISGDYPELLEADGADSRTEYALATVLRRIFETTTKAFGAVWSMIAK